MRRAQRLGWSPSRLSRITLLLLLAGGCAAHTATVSKVAGPSAPGRQRPTTDERAIAHVLSRVTFGARPGDIQAVEATGVAAYLERQLHPDRIDDARLDARLSNLTTLSLSARTLADDYFKPAQMERRKRQAEQAAATAGNTGAGGRPAQSGAAASPAAQGAARPATPAENEALRRERQVMTELSAQKVLRAVGSERQLQEVLVDFWFNHFNVFAGKGADRLYLTEYERDVIRPHVFGRFRDLLGAVAHSPAMLFYLDNWLSTDPNGPHPVGAAGIRRPMGAGIGRQGLVPRQPMTRPAAPRPAARAGLNENYARELMELHTLGVDGGYTQHDVTEVARAFTGWTITGPNNGGGFTFDPRRHDEGQKVVLGHVIKEGGGQGDGEKVLDILASQPATARFIATKLARRFVADDPPTALVDRAAARFRETGGDLREVVRAILTSPEFYAPAAYGAKAKTPLEFVASALRAADARVDDPAPVVNTLRVLGMPLYGCQPPTGYADRADAWTNAGALLGRLTFASALASNRLRGVSVDLQALAATGNPSGQRGQLAQVLLGGRATPDTLSAVERQASVADAAALALGSPEFQKK